jgi:hypothetical protein
MFFRHPQELLALRRKAKIEWKEIIAGAHPDLPDNLKLELSKFEEDFANTESVDAEDLALTTLERVVDSQRIGSILVKMRWHVYTLPSGYGSFLTSDNPCIKTETLRGPDASIFLPLSPQKVLVGAQRNIDDLLNAESPSVIVKMVNEDIVRIARQYVIANSLKQTRFIENRRGKFVSNS